MLRPIQEMFDPVDHPDLIVGLGVPDDAAVYRLDDERALIFTADFFTPIVDDPYQYGAIAAANALSDIYAMGGKPLLALNIAAFPTDLPSAILVGIMRGAAATVQQANAVIAGGHTIQDKEPKFGLAVVGIAHPDQLLTKDRARPGDALALTKPLGTGSITTAAKNDRVRPEHLMEAVDWMRQLNRAASEIAVSIGARCATDITGFGLLGHASEVAESSRVTLSISMNNVPLMSGVHEYAEQWIFPGGSTNNFKTFSPRVQFDSHISKEDQMILSDAQTSGGLLVCVPEQKLHQFESDMERLDVSWWHIGEVKERGDYGIEVRS